MSPTVQELRNAIRVETSRFERDVKPSFTKEELRAVCETLRVGVNAAGRPSTSRLRRLIRAHVGIAESLAAADDATFRKTDLQAFADHVGVSFES